MTANTNIGLLLSNKIDRTKFITSLLSDQCPTEFSYLNQLKGLLFSSDAIEDMIELELRHDVLNISDRPLQSFSSGERKKKFLQYLLHKKPDYLILDTAFDHLDPNSKLALTNTLSEYLKKVHFIQIENRKKNFLPFITTRYEIKDNSFQISKIENLEEKQHQLSLNALPKLKSNFHLEGEKMIVFKSVCVSYEQRPIVKDICWTINKGDFWQLIGPNGSGKSTLLSLITGDNPKGYGQDLYIFGRKRGSGESVRSIKKHIGYYNPILAEMFWRYQTLEQMILSGFYDSVGLYVNPTSLHKKIASDWLTILGLSTLKNTPYSQLSQGLQRVTLIVRAFIKQPPLLILDEPLEGLDEEAVTLVCDLINRLVKETNTTIIYVSHQAEKRINPKAIFNLTPTKEGSLGNVVY